MVSKLSLWALLCSSGFAACSGREFSSKDETTIGISAGESGSGNSELEPVIDSAGRATNGGADGNEPISGSGKMGILAGSGSSSMSDGGGGDLDSPKPSTWLCRTDGNVCQCYSDPSVFEPGWLTDEKCVPSLFCTNRDMAACVCWATEEAAKSAMTVKGTVKVERCPE